MKTSRKRLCFLALAMAFAISAFAQRDLGTITGTVTDPTGASVPKARINIIEQGTEARYSVEADETGTYVRTLLKPGTYRVEVESPGFNKAIRRDIALIGGERVGVNIALQVGEVTQSVEIRDSTPLLQTEDTTLGKTLTGRSVSELPLGGQRKFTFLALTAPGVVPAEQGARDAAGGGFSANGVRSNGQNNFLLNGVDNNVNVIDFINQTSYVIGPSVEAIGEMKVVTNGYSAEYGRGAGGVVNVTLKSGTNDLHGTLFEFLQNDKLNSNLWELNRVGRAKGPFKQNQYGAAVGGPAIRNRTFWFADWQGTRIRSAGGTVPGLGNTFVMTIPKPEFRNGDFSSLLGTRILGTDAAGNQVLEGAIFDILSNRTVGSTVVRDMFPGNRIPASRFDPAAKRLIDLYPNPNQNLADRVPGSNFVSVTNGRQNNDQYDVRVDHMITAKDSIFGSLSWSEESKFNSTPLPGALDAAGFGGQQEKNQGRNAMLSYTRVWSPNFLTETRAAFSRLITERVQGNSDKDLFTEFGIKGFNPTGSYAANGGLPNIQPEGYNSVGGAEWLPTKEYSNVWDFVQNVSINKGRHAVKFGYEYRPIKFPFFQVPSARGTFRFQRNRTDHPQFTGTGDGLASWLLGYPGNSTITTTNFISSDKTAHAWYVQDDWKVTQKLTVNVGLRYELFSPIGERFGRQSNYLFDGTTLHIPKGKDQDAPLPPNFATDFPQIKVVRRQVDKYMIPWDRTDFGPRIGVAYQLMPKTVFRAAYGMFYGGEENQGGNPNRGESVPFNQTQNLNLVRTSDLNPFLGRFSDGWPTNVFALPASISFRGVVNNFRNSLVSKWNATLQHELGWNSALEVSYIASRGMRQLILWDPNQPVNSPLPNQPADPRRLQPFLRGGITQTDSFGRSSYHALSTRLERRFSDGLTFTGSYTWGHTMADTGTTLSGSTGFGLRDIVCGYRCEYSSAAWDIRQRLAFSWVYELPFGRGRKYGASMNRAADILVGGWQANGILTFSTGQPFSLTARNFVGSFLGTVRPDAVSGKSPHDEPSGGRTPDLWFDTSAVQDPRSGTNGNLGNQTNYGPGIRNLDFSLFKDFRISERYRFQLRNEWFNSTNTPRFSVGSIGNQLGQSNFGRIGSTLSGSSRSVQFALRLMF